MVKEKEVVKKTLKKKKPSENRKRPSLIFNFQIECNTLDKGLMLQKKTH
jgi:hypothetical protein